mmetsp:Transcript_56000/g.119073  ORF Transcript_56000/g.119073 Transcript_56000/m.119073 type:complete len:117 (+) Transcript_56000:90-440(+)
MKSPTAASMILLKNLNVASFSFLQNFLKDYSISLRRHTDLSEMHQSARPESSDQYLHPTLLGFISELLDVICCFCEDLYHLPVRLCALRTPNSQTLSNCIENVQDKSQVVCSNSQF